MNKTLTTRVQCFTIVYVVNILFAYNNRDVGLFMAKTKKLAPGDAAPDGVCLNIDDLPVSLSTFWEKGPILLTFLRHFG